MLDKHGGIARVVRPDDVGRVAGWAYTSETTAYIRFDIGGESACLECPPLWASRLFAKYVDQDVPASLLMDELE